jgi:hypothetical protein
MIEMMNPGQLPQPELLRTPAVSDVKGGLDPEVAKERGNQIMLAGQAVALMQTPSVADALGGHATRSGPRAEELLLPGQARAVTTGSPEIPGQDDGPLLPSPNAYKKGGSQHPDKRREGRHQVSLQDVTEHELQVLPTPRSQVREMIVREGGHKHNLEEVMGELLLPTPATGIMRTPDVEHQMQTRNSPGLESIPGLLGMPKETWTKYPENRKEALLPTPVTTDAANRDIRNQMDTRDSPGLDCIPAFLGMPQEKWQASAKLLPTPDVSSAQRTRESYEKGDHQISLHNVGDLIQDATAPGDKLLPTTRAAMGESRNSNIYDRPGASNLENVVDSTGVRTSRRSNAGNESQDDQCPGQLSLADVMDLND